MKTLADLKRDLSIGDKIELVTLEEDRDGTFREVVIPEKLQGIRTISHKDTTGFYLKQASDTINKKGSFCGYPKAGNLKYTDKTFEIIERDNDGTIWQKRVYQIN